jgi:hypothetical protein
LRDKKTNCSDFFYQDGGWLSEHFFNVPLATNLNTAVQLATTKKKKVYKQLVLTKLSQFMFKHQTKQSLSKMDVFLNIFNFITNVVDFFFDFIKKPFKKMNYKSINTTPKITEDCPYFFFTPIDEIDEVETKVTKYPCDSCEKTFRSLPALNYHVKAIHQGIRFPCQICFKNFTQKESVKVHIKTIHQGIYFTCQICSNKYNQKQNLKVHINRVHECPK